MQELNFDQISMEERGRVLNGRYAHFCFDWDGMTVDETTVEFLSCNCTFEEADLNHDKDQVKDRMREEKCDACRGAGRFEPYIPGTAPFCMSCGGSGLAFP